MHRILSSFTFAIRILLPAWLALSGWLRPPAAGLAAARAEEPGSLVLARVEAADFPRMRLYFEAYDGWGNFIPNLRVGDVTVLEDEQAVPLDELTRLQSGVQVIVAVNEAPELSNRYEGRTRLEAIVSHLLTWAEAQPATTTDDFSLASNTGVQARRLDRPAAWQEALTAYQPALLTAKPGLGAISAALDLATDPNPNPFMKRAILYVTPLPADSELEAYQNLASRARQQGVQVQVWLVASAETAARRPDAVEALTRLGEGSGGGFFLFTGQENLPDLDAWLEPMRYVYQAAYTSRLNKSGSYPISLHAARGGLELTSTSRRVEVKVAAPNPIFLSPPSTVERAWSQPEDGGEPVLLPDQLKVNLLVEFPDGHTRPLEAVRLYADGELAAEITEAPFDQVVLDLSGYTESGAHALQLEVVDSLGLTRRSIEITMQVQVEPGRPGTLLQRLLRNDGLAGYIAIAAAALALGLVLAVRWRGQRHEEPADGGQNFAEPVTRPIIPAPEPRRPRPARRPAPLREDPNAPAWLAPLAEDGRTVPVNRKEITLGSDPQQASVVLDCPSVSPLHCRLQALPDGTYWLSDCGSVAGTWVNYAPISSQGVRLEHGDLIQIGRMAYRFALSGAQNPQPGVES